MDASADDAPVLEVRDLSVSYFLRAGEARVVRGLDLTIRRGESIGLVGESGCGKSTAALAIVRYLSGSGRIVGGRIAFEGRDLATMSEAELRAVRGRRIAVVYQDPLSCLNPVMTVGRQVAEVPMLHEDIDKAEAYARAVRVLREVNIPDPEAVMRRYPHQLSGGQQQRIVIAMALIAEPALLVMDEPTTGLDVTVEAAVLELVRALRERLRTAILYISHNLGTIVRVCDRVGVLYGGELVEEGTVREVFRAPRHPYTRGLLDCLPGAGASKRAAALHQIPGQVRSPLERAAGCGFADRCPAVERPRCTSTAVALGPMAPGATHRVRCLRAAELAPWRGRGETRAPGDGRAQGDAVLRVAGLSKQYASRRGPLGGAGPPLRALNEVELEAPARQTLAIVGESGCGKSTLARVLSGLTPASAGSALLDGVEVANLDVERRPAALKRKVQMVFQNPESTLNPCHRVGYAVSRSLRRLRGVVGPAARAEIAELLSLVKLPADVAARMPRQLSGGQKQRVAIARALAARPSVIIADEPVSALDVSVQAAILNLMNELQAATGTTYLFVSHDLSVVRYVADHVAVMYMGRVVEFGTVDEVYAPPFHPYTEALLSAAPLPDPDAVQAPIVLEGALPNPAALPRGCAFCTRCPRRIGPVCDETPPPERRLGAGHRIACHLPVEALAGTPAD